jgi:ribonuclease J
VVSLVLDSRGQLAGAVQMAIEGLPEVEDDEESIGDLIRRTISGTLKSIPPKRRADIELVNAALQRAIRSEVSNYWGKKPNVAVFVHGV